MAGAAVDANPSIAVTNTAKTNADRWDRCSGRTDRRTLYRRSTPAILSSTAQTAAVSSAPHPQPTAAL